LNLLRLWQKNKMTIGISGFGHFLPETEIANEQLVAHFGYDSALMASQMAIRDAGLPVSDIDGLVLTTSSPDYMQPPTLCVVHGKLGLKDAFAFDVMSVCSSFVYGLGWSRSLPYYDLIEISWRNALKKKY
jgi:3-oxoacyl-[acyl-carrier-protein] synthase III